MKNAMKRTTTTLVLFLCLVANLFAQQSRIRIEGKITDAANGDPLIGANVVVEGTTIGTVTALDGTYSLLVPGPDSKILFSYIGYVPQTINIGDQRVINVQLGTDATQLEEVVITSQAKGQIGARQAQIASSTIVNVVAPDRLQENPDANAVEAIGRLPGVSVIRSGGEGAQVVIRGLEPRYTNITLDGENMASSNTGNRGTNISGISQYVLQGVEVYKSLTPDLEANSVGGTVNLKLQDIPDSLHYSLMAQGGYNDLNNYYGNYKFMGEISNRFFNNKFGFYLSLNTERVNRSTHTMSGSYSNPSTDIDILLNSTNLNIINRYNTRSSATLSMDYKVHPSTVLKLYGIYTNSNVDFRSQSKSYNHTGVGNVNYSAQYYPVDETSILHTSLKGETKSDFLNMEINYGLTYSRSQGNSPDRRTWNWNFIKVSTNEITTNEMRRKDPSELIPLYTDDPDSIHNTSFGGMSSAFNEKDDENITANLDIKIPYQIGDFVTGYAKLGGKYRKKERFVDLQRGTQIQHQFIQQYWYDDNDWMVPGPGTGAGSFHSLVNYEDYIVDDFLGGEYDYGWYFNFDRMNQLSDWWESWSDSVYYELDPGHRDSLISNKYYVNYIQDLEHSVMNDQKITEEYYAGYLMTELNFGRYVMFMPGFRYEKTDATMTGWTATQPQLTPSQLDPLLATDTTNTRQDEFFLPMAHLRIKPTKNFYMHFAYTQSISRPDFNQITPNYFFNTGYNFVARKLNPQLKTEFWTNYDAQLTYHGNKIGLLSVSGFYKTVEDKIWARNYKRISSDPIIAPFGQNDVVSVNVIENHPYDIELKGVEVEWQTSFWYAPKPLNFITLYLNYTFTDSDTKYPNTKLETVLLPGERRPTTIRIDSVISGPMLYQPKHIANASLGFNYKEFNTWLSFQYNGEIFTSKNYNVNELDHLKEHFYRVDLQMTYDIPLRGTKGELQVLGNFANLSNFMERAHLRGDPRYTNQEAYGWTVDLGVRYRF